ncbi:MAG: biopolymer transporter ExbD [Verrucomicrobia bacterium]|nr:biopolymer transporter ExbD [Verrucomicrobiota bacterium]
MAGSSGGNTGGKKKARIEIIPLIDVIFFLLATFVLFTLSLNTPQGVPVVLPQSESGVERDTAGTATVSVTEQGSLAWDKEFVELGDFLNRLKAFYTQNPEGRILINGDENAPFNQAIYVFDEARKAGFKKIFIETQVRATR